MFSKVNQYDVSRQENNAITKAEEGQKIGMGQSNISLSTPYCMFDFQKYISILNNKIMN